MALTPGTQFGAYRILGLLGQGGMGEVYRALQPSPTREVALKVISPSLAADPTFRLRFKREADILARLEHPNIVPIYEVGEIDGQPYICYRYIRGGTLGDLVGKPLPPAQVVELLEPVAAALDFAYAQGFLHRDIKPGNILLSEPDDRGRRTPVVADFGLARLVGPQDGGSEAEPLTQVGMGIGTPVYMAPEQILGRQPLDGSVDQYSLATMAFLLLTGTFPFRGGSATEQIVLQVSEPPPPPSSRCPSLPSAVDWVVLRALEKAPAARFPSCGAFITALRAAAVSEPTVVAWRTPPPTLPTMPSPTTPTPGSSAEPASAPPWRAAEDGSGEWVRPAVAPRSVPPREQPATIAAPVFARPSSLPPAPVARKSHTRRLALIGGALVLLAAGGTAAGVVISQQSGSKPKAGRTAAPPIATVARPSVISTQPAPFTSVQIPTQTVLPIASLVPRTSTSAATIAAPTAARATVASGTGQSAASILPALDRTSFSATELPSRFVLVDQKTGALAYDSEATQHRTLGARYIEVNTRGSTATIHDDIQYTVFATAADASAFLDEASGGTGFAPAGFAATARCKAGSSGAGSYGFTQCFTLLGDTVIISDSDVAGANRGNDDDASALLEVGVNHLQKALAH